MITIIAIYSIKYLETKLNHCMNVDILYYRYLTMSNVFVPNVTPWWQQQLVYVVST